MRKLKTRSVPLSNVFYAISLECGTREIYLYTLHCHMQYTTKAVFDMSERFPNKFAKIGMDLNFEWFQKWNELRRHFEEQWTDLDRATRNENIEKEKAGLSICCNV